MEKIFTFVVLILCTVLLFGCTQNPQQNLPAQVLDSLPANIDQDKLQLCSTMDYNTGRTLSAIYCPGLIKPIGLMRDSEERFRADIKANPGSALSSVGGLSCLERLFIPKAGQALDLSLLNKLKNLKCLHIDMGNEADLSPISELNEMLYISHLGNKITDISAINKMNLLIGFKAKIQNPDLSPLKGKTKLRELTLDYTELDTELSSEADLSPLAELVSLERLFLFHFRATDFSPIMKLKKLTYVEMSFPKNANVTSENCQALFHSYPTLKGSCTASDPEQEQYVTIRGAK